MKHLIMGTAGHVDHGKTALIKALTDFDCDTHKDEKNRGITIHLGFTHLDLPNGTSIGIIDVPGHKDFINTMISGASTIDFVLFTIAADSSIMPQTREHLHIMELLGIKKGIIALTKNDTVDEEILELVELEISEFVAGTFLENAPIISTSVKDNTGIKELLQEIRTITDSIETRSSGLFFRMYIDRIFSVAGFGTVINGSVLQGSATKNTPLYLLPGGKELRIRKMEHHRKEVDKVLSGQRASLNVVGLDVQDFHRGMLVSEHLIKSSVMIDATITLFEHERTLERWNTVLFLMGTFEDQVRVHLLDKDSLKEGETALVQIHFERECLPIFGDSFIIRSTSGDITLGGGRVLDAYPLHHKRRTQKVVQHLSRIADGEIPAFIAAEVQKRSLPVSIHTLAEITNLPENEIERITRDLLPGDILTKQTAGKILLVHKDKEHELIQNITGIISKHHTENPFLKKGKTFDELTGMLGLLKSHDMDYLGLLIKQLVKDNILAEIEGTFALSEVKVSISEENINKIDQIEQFILRSGMKVPLMSEISNYAGKRNIDPNMLQNILNYLVENKTIVTIEGSFIHADIVKQAQDALFQHFKSNEKLVLSDFRDRLNANRKICLLLLSYFDDLGLTVRKGDFRVLTEKGKTFIK